MHRAVTVGLRNVHIFGITYSSSEGGAAISDFILGRRGGKPTTLLVESFHAPRSSTVRSGEEIDYRSSLLPRSGLDAAMSLVERCEFRARWTAEAVATLSALRTGASVVFADRLHTSSFDRIVRRHNLDELRHALISSVESLAASMESGGGSPAGQASSSSPPSPPSSLDRLLAQNALCVHFGELWSERHALMAHFASRTQGDVALVCGSEHVEPVARLLEDAGQRAELSAADLSALLDESETSRGSPPSSHWGEDELEKRAALAALLVTTRQFPPEVVLPSSDELGPEDLARAQAVYPKYRAAFAQRLQLAAEAAAGRGADGDGQVRGSAGGAGQGGGAGGEAQQQASSPYGLSQLPDLCQSLGQQSCRKGRASDHDS